ncbi:MAG: glycosyltransferase family 2 protein [Lentimicrobiaceae bacterium]|nr:glycosyltransferase family 2 protein [Lentimicrobiaceae bacterium]
MLIPGYKEDMVVVESASDALQQNYPKDMFDVVVIADSLQPNTLKALNNLPIKLIEVSFEKSTKSKALNKAMEQLPEDYAIAIILDADNLMERDFLKKINMSFAAGYLAVQGHRVAKNMNTPFAILDAISEEINNHIFRKGHRVSGLSSAIIGSGMAFEYSYFKNLMNGIKAVGGFDKEIELKMLKEGKTIEYLPDAYVYDEKVQKSEVFSNQRRRWLSAQVHYFRIYILDAIKEVFVHRNIDYFDKAFQFIQPPRILLLGIITIIFIFSLIFNPLYIMLFWLYLFGICVFTFLLSIPIKFYNIQTLKAIVYLPKGFFLMLISLLKIKGANQRFIHTQHTSIKNNK